MATPLATAFVRIRPDTSKFESETKSEVGKAGRGLANEGKKHGRLFGASFVRASAGPFRSIIGVVGGPLSAAFAGVAGIKVFSGFVADARESARVGRLTAQVIKSTGGAANITAGQVGKLAESISNKTGKDDEAIQSGANLLLTFTNIRNETGRGNDIFNQASAAIVDMTAALNNGQVTAQGMKSSSIQLGKALNNPIKGVSALERIGVGFTESQKKQIKTLVESGRTLDAQKIILKELGKEFGGAAKASADPMERLRTIVGNLGERLGTVLLPFIDKTASFLTDKAVPAVSKFFDEMKKGTGAGGTFAAVLKVLVGVLQVVGGFITGTLIPAVQNLAKWISQNKEIIPALGIGIAVVLVPAFIAWAVAAGAAAVATIAAAAPIIAIGAAITLVAFLIIKNWDKIKSATIAVWNAVKNAITTAASAVFTFFKTKWPLLLALITGPIGIAVLLVVRNFDKIKNAATSVYNWVREKFAAVISFIKTLPGKIASAASGMWDGIKNAFKSAINGIISGWNRLGIPGFSVNVNIPGPVPDVHFSWSGLSLPDIPYLAQGGIVRHRRNGMLAVLAETSDEAVIPLNRGGGAAAMGNTYNITVSVPPNADLAEVGRVTVQAIKLYEKGSGAGWRR